MEIDDNCSTELPPFSHDVSVWSLLGDLNLATRTAAEIFRNMHEVLDDSRFRGFLQNAAAETIQSFKSFVDPTEVTWLTARELFNDRHWLPREHSKMK